MIAIVEPDVACCIMLRELLDEEGYEVLAGATTHEVARLLGQRQPDVAIVDVGPAMIREGADVLGLVHRTPMLEHIPVILCSTNPHCFDGQEQALRAIGGAILVKPFDIHTLMGLVQAAVRRERA